MIILYICIFKNKQMGIIFQICCGIITVLAYIFGTTYEEMNTYLFIYAQPAILLLSFGVVIGVVLFKLVRRFSFLKTFLLFLFGFLGLGYLAQHCTCGSVIQPFPRTMLVY